MKLFDVDKFNKLYVCGLVGSPETGTKAREVVDHGVLKYLPNTTYAKVPPKSNGRKNSAFKLNNVFKEY